MNRKRLCQLAEELRCPLCLEFFQVPRVLSCQHSFCTDCLERLYNVSPSRFIKCPLCREDTDLTGTNSTSVLNLPVNIPLDNIVSHLSPNYQSRSPSPDFGMLPSGISPAFPPGSCGVDYSFSAIPPRSPSPIVRLERSISPQFCNVAPIDFPIFQVTERLFEWVGNLWFAPSDMLKDVQSQYPFDISIEYLPFYILDFGVNTSCKAIVSDQSISRLDNIRGENETSELISKELTRQYSHLVCACKDEKIFSLTQNINDWNAYTAIPNCQVVSAEDYYSWPTVWHLRGVEDEIFKKEEKYISQDIKKDYALRSMELRVEFSEVLHTQIYLPVYITHYTYKSCTYRVIVSAQTGTVSAERPFGFGSAGHVLNKIRGWFISN